MLIPKLSILLILVLVLTGTKRGSEILELLCIEVVGGCETAKFALTQQLARCQLVGNIQAEVSLFWV